MAGALARINLLPKQQIGKCYIKFEQKMDDLTLSMRNSRPNVIYINHLFWCYVIYNCASDSFPNAHIFSANDVRLHDAFYGAIRMCDIKFVSIIFKVPWPRHWPNRFAEMLLVPHHHKRKLFLDHWLIKTGFSQTCMDDTIGVWRVPSSEAIGTRQRILSLKELTGL